MSTIRGGPADRPAAWQRPGRSGIDRSTWVAADRLSDNLPRGTGAFFEQRQAIAGLGTPATGALAVVGLHPSRLLPTGYRIAPTHVERRLWDGRDRR